MWRGLAIGGTGRAWLRDKGYRRLAGCGGVRVYGAADVGEVVRLAALGGRVGVVLGRLRWDTEGGAAV